MTGYRMGPLVLAVFASCIAGCGPRTVQRDQTDIDPAIRLFLEGRTAEAVQAFERLAREARSDETRREVYYFLGRSHEARGEIQQAIDAFTLAVQYGDKGASMEYLNRLTPLLESRPEGFVRLPTVTRRQLAALVVRWVQGDSVLTAGGDPLAIAIQAGWMSELPDGKVHGDAQVSHAAFAVFLERLCRQTRCRDVARVIPDEQPISGRDVVRALQSSLPAPMKHG